MPPRPRAVVQPSRIRAANHVDPAANRDYVLYWMQVYRRLDYNHALDHVLNLAVEWKKPLVVYEGLRLDYPWANRRLHQFILEGMRDNEQNAAKLGINYWPFVETPDRPGRGLLRELSQRACAIVTDDFPAFIVPKQTASLAARCDVPVIAVDSNSVTPLSQLGAPVSAAVHLRTRIHKVFVDSWKHRAVAKPVFPASVLNRIKPPFELWQSSDLEKTLTALPFDDDVRPVVDTIGGPSAARKRLRDFVRRRLTGYAAERNHPTSLKEGHSSGLSPYLHFGHISIEEVVSAVLKSRAWVAEQIDSTQRGKRDGFFCGDADVNSFLDEAITWRDVGQQWHWHRAADTASLERALPAWALSTLTKHEKDRRDHEYALEEFESAATHDPLWNAAQCELVKTGRIHNYLRMLWGKKVIEWSKSPSEAYRILEHLNNKYALDGRDPNSYTGILWCFGLFDRPWFPERPIFGHVRYMSSENTARKFDLEPYYEYIAQLV